MALSVNMPVTNVFEFSTDEKSSSPGSPLHLFFLRKVLSKTPDTADITVDTPCLRKEVGEELRDYYQK